MNTEEMQNALVRAGGTNPFGQPNFRLIWSEDRLEIAYGQQKKRYGESRNRWMLEKWCPPEMYGSQEEWERTKDLDSGEYPLGPFPRRGDYEHSYTFEDETQRPVTPTIGLVELVCRVIEAGKMHTKSMRWKAIKDAQEKRKRDEKAYFDSLWEDAQGPFGGNAVSGLPGKRTPADVRLDMTTKDLKKLNKKIPLKSGFKQI